MTCRLITAGLWWLTAGTLPVLCEGPDMDSKKYARLNEARRWWLANIPWLGRIPSDQEVLDAYEDALRTRTRF